MTNDLFDGMTERATEFSMVRMWQASNQKPLHNETATLHCELAAGRCSWGDDVEVVLTVQQQWELHKPRTAWMPLTLDGARDLRDHLSKMIERVESDSAVARLTSGDAA